MDVRTRPATHGNRFDWARATTRRISRNVKTKCVRETRGKDQQRKADLKDAGEKLKDVARPEGRSTHRQILGARAEPGSPMGSTPISGSVWHNVRSTQVLEFDPIRTSA
jgi:hypothetical protein